MREENILREEEWERACARLLKTRWRQQHRGESLEIPLLGPVVRTPFSLNGG